MKRIRLLILMIIPLNVLSQELIDESKTWNVLDCCNPSRTKTYRFWGDTVINTINYNKLYYSFSENFDSTISNYAAALRQENQKVYIIYPESEESLLYDFSLELADTITIDDFYGNQDLTMLVDSVDSVLINYESYKRLLFEDIEPFGNYEPQVWIESIGSSYGIIEVTHPHIPDLSTDLLCVKVNSTIIYQSDAFGTCYISPDNINEILKINEVVLFPNPVIEKLYVQTQYTNNLNNLFIEILNIYGQVVVGENFSYYIDMSNIDKGIYFIKIINTSHNLVEIKKIIKI